MERMQKSDRRDNSLCIEIKSSIEILTANEKEMTLSGNAKTGREADARAPKGVGDNLLLIFSCQVSAH